MSKNHFMMALGLEDEAPNVEINFNIDNGDGDSEGVKEGGESVLETDPVSEAAVAASESEMEADKAEDEQEQLEEAQSALESLQLAVSKYPTLSMESLFVLNTVIKNVTRNTRVNTVSLESYGNSDLQRKYIAEELVTASLEATKEQLKVLNPNFFKKLKDKYNAIFNKTNVLEKRVDELLNLVKSADNSKKEVENVKPGGLFGDGYNVLTNAEYNNFNQLYSELSRLNKFYNSVKPPKYDHNYDESYLDQTKVIFDISEKWKKIEPNGAFSIGTIYPESEMVTILGIDFYRGTEEWGIDWKTNKFKRKKGGELPTLTTKEAITILNFAKDFIKQSDRLEKLLEESYKKALSKLREDDWRLEEQHNDIKLHAKIVIFGDLAKVQSLVIEDICKYVSQSMKLRLAY